MSRVRTLLASLVVACGSVVGLSAPAIAVGPPISVWSFNACGHSCHQDSPDPILAGIGVPMAQTRPFAVLVQEICINQATALADYTGYHFVFSSAISACSVNGAPASFGNAVFSKNAFTGERLVWNLPNEVPGSEPRTMVCDSTPGLLSEVMLCSTHLALQQASRVKQVDVIAGVANSPVGMVGTLVIGGDFNATPGTAEIKKLYNQYTEADWHSGCPQIVSKCGRATYQDGRKIDYLWSFDARGGGIWQRNQTQAIPGLGSDHLLYRSVLAP